MITPSKRGPSTTTERWLGTGASVSADPGDAGRAAVEAALVGDDPALTIVFASVGYDLDHLVGTIAELTPGVPMIGCTTAGEIAVGTARDQSVAVAVLGGAYDIVTSCGPPASDDLAGAGAKAATAVSQLPPSEHQILLLLTDGLAGDQQQVVRGAYDELGAGVPLVGGCAGDDTAMDKTFQIHDGAVVDDAVVGAAIGAASPFGIGVRHGWRPIGEPMLVTSSDGTTVHELDQAPALHRYLERLGLPSSTAASAEHFTTVAMTHPLGLERRSTREVRFINGADPEQGTVHSIAEIPEGALVWVMEGDVDSVLAGTVESCDQAIAGLDGADPIGLVLFDCIARRSVLGDDGVEAQMATIASSTGSIPAVGFYTYGEIARTHGVRGFHNQTLVTLALS